MESRLTPFKIVWSGGGTATTSRVFHDLTGAIPSNQVVKIRGSLERRRNSSNASGELAIRYSDDGETWDAPNAFGGASSAADGWTYGTTFVDVTSGYGTRKLLAQIGVWVMNSTGAAIEFVEVRAQLDFAE